MAFFRRAPRAAPRDEEAGGERDDEAGICVTRPSPTESFTKTSAAWSRPSVARDADDDAAENVDGRDDEAGDGVAAHEFRGAVHGAEEGALLLQLRAAGLGLALVDEAGGEIGVDRHLLAGDGVEGEARADFGDPRRALGDDEEVDRDEDREDHEADDEIAAHHEFGEAADHVAAALAPRRRG